MMKMFALFVTIVISNLMTSFIMMKLAFNKNFIKKQTKRYMNIIQELQDEMEEETEEERA